MFHSIIEIMMDELKKSNSKGIWFPNDMFNEIELPDGKHLGWVAKFIFLEIHSFKENNNKPCFYSNAYLADKYHISKTMVSKHINELIDAGLIEFVRFDGKKRYLRSLSTAKYKAGKV